MSKISVTTIAGLTSGGDANKVKIESGDTLQVESNATVGGTLAVTGTTTTAAITSSGRHDVNFNGSGTQAFKYTDTGGGNLASFGQFYNPSNALIGNIQNANNDGIHINVKNGSLVFSNVGYTAANALDDYEEGTATITMIGSSSNPNTAVTVSARYVKIGRLVSLASQFSNVDTTGASGAVRLTGLPFTATQAHAAGNVMFYVRFALGGTSTNVSPYISGTQVQFYQSTSGAGWGEISHSAGTGAYLSFSVIYEATT